jgi:hypothetical protein
MFFFGIGCKGGKRDAKDKGKEFLEIPTKKNLHLKFNLFPN